MKTRSIILITISAIVLISIAVRETGLLELDFYKSNNRLSATDHWEEIDTAEPKDKGRKTVRRNDLSILILRGKDTLYRKINKLAPIVVVIDTLDAGPMWFPLYKSTKYTANASTSLFENGFNDPSFHGIVRHLEGVLNFHGELTIMGMCSNRTAKKIMYASIVKNITEKVTAKFAALPEDFFTERLKKQPVGQEVIIAPTPLTR